MNRRLIGFALAVAALGGALPAVAQQAAPDTAAAGDDAPGRAAPAGGAVRLPGLAVTVRRSLFDPGLARSVERWAPGDGTSAWQSLSDWLDARGATSVRGFGGGGRQVLSIRGSRPEGVLVLLDGVPLNDPVTGTADLSTVSLASLASVTLVRGSGAARYGSGALAGALLLESGAEGDGRSARLAAGSFGRREASGRAGMGMGETSLELSAGLATAENDYPFENRLAPGSPVETRSGADHTSLWAGVGVRTDRLRANARLDDLERGIPGRSGTTAFAGSRWAERRASANASYLLGRAALRAGVRRLGMTYTPGDGGEPARQHATDIRAGAEGELPGPVPALLALRFSAERLSGDAVADAPTRLAAGATLRHDLRLGGATAEAARFGLEPALSVDVTRGASAASPELGAWYRTGAGSRLYGRVGQAFRIPTFADLHFEAAPGVRANADL
ncbi:MAG: TonB-dependent receptor, partial [Gemmatimonadota bacterium]